MSGYRYNIYFQLADGFGHIDMTVNKPIVTNRDKKEIAVIVRQHMQSNGHDCGRVFVTEVFPVNTK
jgi:uncharacterized protein (UPF0371 family)